MYRVRTGYEIQANTAKWTGMGLRTTERVEMTERVTSDPDFAELDELRRVGILTDAEYRDARDKLIARQQFDLLPALSGTVADTPESAAATPGPSHATRPRHAAVRGRHAKQPARWPWIVGSAVVLALAIIVGIALRPAAHHAHTARRAAPPSPSAAPAKPIVVASPANTAMTINLDGADAQVAVSRLVAVPPANAVKSAQPARPAMTTYTATVTVAGRSGAFSIDPAEFSAHSESGRTYAVAATASTTLPTTTVAAGQQTSGAIAFTVPTGEHIAVVLFTTPLGEQLGLWSTS